jgi:hypothetical protein
MPRRTNGQPKREIQREMSARWKYVLRHPDFRKDLRELRVQYRQDQHAANPIHKQIIEKWKLKDIPFDILTVPYISDHPPYKNAFYETICPQATIRYPVESHDAFEKQLHPPAIPPSLQPGQFLQISVDLSYPDTLLLSMIAGDIRSVRPQRRHRDSDDDYLDVYDRAEKGETFVTMAAALSESIPTLKSRLRAACRKIYGPGHIPPKWQLKTIGLDAATHAEYCLQCQNALSVEQMCPQGQAYVNQDTAGQADLAHEKVEMISDKITAREFRVNDSREDPERENGRSYPSASDV